MLILEGFDHYAEGVAGTINSSNTSTEPYNEFETIFANSAAGAQSGSATITDRFQARKNTGRAIRFDRNPAGSTAIGAAYAKLGLLAPADLASVGKFTVGFWIKPVVSPEEQGSALGTVFAFSKYSNTSSARVSNLLSITAHSNGALLMYITSAAYADRVTIATNSLGKWQLIEIVCDVTAGIATVYVDGTVRGITPAGILNSLMTALGADGMGIMISPPYNSNSVYAETLFDDIYFHANTEGHTGDPLGELKIHAFSPSSNSQAQFTPVGAASNLEAVSDDSNATYVTAAAPAKDLYTLAATTEDDIVAIQSSAVAKTDTGTADLSVGVNAAGTQHTVDAAAWKARHHISTVNPATGLPWTPADLATLKSGYAYGTW